jgi:YjbE family integral membrane protein
MQEFFQMLSSEAASLMTPAGLTALAAIILIDVVMSGDNALLIGMAVKGLSARDRKRAIFWGILLATLLRIAFASVAVLLLSVIGVKLAGGLLLLYVVFKLYRELRSEAKGQEHGSGHAVTKTFAAAISSIVIADVSMSLDNVLAVAGAANENLVALGIGLVISIALMAIAANLVAKLLEKYSWIQWAGLAILAYVALHMIYGGGAEVYGLMDER